MLEGANKNHQTSFEANYVSGHLVKDGVVAYNNAYNGSVKELMMNAFCNSVFSISACSILDLRIWL